MFKIKYSPLICFIFTFNVITGCTLAPSYENAKVTNAQTPAARAAQLAQIIDWKIKGKIGFIQGKKRETASINWQIKQSEQKQQLNLTTFLGINVLHLSSKDGVHNIKVDGKDYQSVNLDKLIYSLIGITLPTQALKSWLKGINYLAHDKITYDEVTQLPTELISRYNNQTWRIKYQKYRTFNQVQLATKFTITRDNLAIKINIYNWVLN